MNEFKKHIEDKKKETLKVVNVGIHSFFSLFLLVSTF